jgi:hypothetical protein
MSALTFQNFSAVSVSILAYFFLSSDHFVSNMVGSLSRSSGSPNSVLLISGIASVFGLLARKFVSEILANRIEE